ncbi:MAG: hypothetical protein AAEJ43_02025 [Gammaproteobacteria bacterium]
MISAQPLLSAFENFDTSARMPLRGVEGHTITCTVKFPRDSSGPELGTMA